MSRPSPLAALLVLLGALVAALLTGPVASAHDVIESSDPAEGAALATAPARVSITLSDAPQGPSTLTVVGPDGTRYEQGAATVVDDTVSVGVNPLGPAGRYEIGYRIVSSDGHPVTGAIAFSLTAPGPGAAPSAGSGPAAAAPATGAPAQPASPAAAQPAPAPASAETEGGVPAWPFVVLAIVVVAGAVAVALRRRAN